jgi:hypothetical protein
MRPFTVILGGCYGSFFLENSFKKFILKSRYAEKTRFRPEAATVPVSY